MHLFAPPLPLIGMPGPGEWIIILVIVLLIFGGRKIPEIARGLGEGIRNFKDSVRGSEKPEEKPAEEKK
ncbi:MAG: twin-arginine translocase TatA/TatE family subunit [Candidatus Acidiferrales bacterium]